MGQYHIVVNFDKYEYIHPHTLGCGLKLVEQIGQSPGTPAALFLLLSSPHRRGGGDFVDANPDVVGRWAGDRIAVIGDYAEDGDIPRFPKKRLARLYDRVLSPSSKWTDISEIVAHELARIFDGRWVGEGWRNFVKDEEFPD